MRSLLLLFLACPLLGLPPTSRLAPHPAALDLDLEDEVFEQRVAEAGKDPEKLWEVYQWCLSTEREREARRVAHKILRIEPEHRAAHEALDHIEYDGQWFTTEKKLEAYKEKEEERLAKERGWVRYKSEWVDPDHIPYLERGLVYDEASASWLSPEEKRRLAEGWVRQDLEWVSPEEIPRMEQGLWKVGDEWVSLEEANRLHSDPSNFWRIPQGSYLLWATVERAVAEMAAREMDRGLRELERFFAAVPSRPLHVAVLRDQAQYDRFATGNDGEVDPAHYGDDFVIARALFAESFFWGEDDDRAWFGMGICYWDHEQEHGDRYGVHAARLAIGFSFVNALDPSPQAVATAAAGKPGRSFVKAYYEEKKIPAWIRYGAAVYTERYYEDNLVQTGGDPWWTRKWSIDSLRSEGGLRPIEQVFAFRLKPEDEPDAKRLLLEAGLLVAFILDGDCQPVKEVHARLQAAWKTGQLEHEELYEELERVLQEHLGELRAFGGL